MDAEALYYVWATLLVLANVLAWGTTLFTLPGNWFIVVFTAVFAFFFPAEDGEGIRWAVVGIAVGLALLGELVEFVAGAAGAAKQGGSRRGMVLALMGAAVGSILGAIVGVPIPVLGSVIAALGGGALGAFVGAYLGETWKGRTSEASFEIGKGALVGRLLGTVGKLAIGAIMVVVVAFDAYV